MNYMTQKIIALIDRDKYPTDTHCMECGSRDGHTEELYTGATDTELHSGWEVWFCCHPCRDADKPCETFFPILLKEPT